MNSDRTHVPALLDRSVGLHRPVCVTFVLQHVLDRSMCLQTGLCNFEFGSPTLDLLDRSVYIYPDRSVKKINQEDHDY